ncbi:MAG: AAA family ATPase [Isosphaeraceae bacterium]
MILESITLRSFCLFRGEQSFDLAPLPAPRNAGARPIVLFGGNNGTGKTTLLDAVQLALEGPVIAGFRRLFFAATSAEADSRFANSLLSQAIAPRRPSRPILLSSHVTSR